MAKTIKFYMICDDHPVRTIDDLREHFGMEDVLDYYKRGIFQRWLKVRGYEAELEAVNQIDSKDDSEALTKLIQIFDVEKDPAKIAEFIGILKYNEEKAKAAAEKKKKEEEEKARAVIEKTENVEEERSNAEEQKMNKDGQNGKRACEVLSVSYPRLPLLWQLILMWRRLFARRRHVSTIGYRPLSVNFSI